MNAHDHEHDCEPMTDECHLVLTKLQQFLDNEVDEATEESIREHLMACEPCMDEADIASAVKSLVKRANSPSAIPEYLQERITMTIKAIQIKPQ